MKEKRKRGGPFQFHDGGDGLVPGRVSQDKEEGNRVSPDVQEEKNSPAGPAHHDGNNMQSGL